MKRAKVAVLNVTPETILEQYERVCELAEMKKALDAGKTTILKDNITWHYLYPGVNTTPWQLEGTIRGLKKAGLHHIVDVHNNTVVTNPYKGEKLNKYLDVYKRYDIPVKYNFKKEDMQWTIFRPEHHKFLVLDKIFPKGVRIPDYFVGKNIIHLPTVKTHTYTKFTGALKNAFGGLLNTKRHYTHTWIHETLVDLLAIQKEIHSGLFAVADGTTAGDGSGPRTVTPVEKNIILASSDMVAIDAVMASFMGYDAMNIKCTRMAHDLGLGVADCKDIEIIGDYDNHIPNWGFSTGSNFATRIGMLLWRSPLKILQKILFHTPLVFIFVLASAFYHDIIWYKRKGKKVVKAWLETAWGKLFTKYT